MRRRKQLQNLTDIVHIRQLEKTAAQQALADAKNAEDVRHSEKMDAQVALQRSYETWHNYVSKGEMVTEHLKFYCDDMLAHETEADDAEHKYDQAVQMSERKISSLKHCDAISQKTIQMRNKLNRKIIRRDDERALSAFEERFSYDWRHK